EPYITRHRVNRRVADQEHGARANGRRRRLELIVDLEVAVRRQQDAGQRRRAFGSPDLTDQGGEHGLSGCPAGVVPAAQDQSFSVNGDASVCPPLGIEVVDHPDLARGLHAANDVPVDAWGAQGRRCCPVVVHAGRDGNDADPALEPYGGAFILRCRRRNRRHEQSARDDGPYAYPRATSMRDLHRVLPSNPGWSVTVWSWVVQRW